MALGIANPQTLQGNCNQLVASHTHPAEFQSTSVAALVVPPSASISPATPVLKHSISGASSDAERASNLVQMANSILKNGFQDSEVDSKEFLEFIRY